MKVQLTISTVFTNCKIANTPNRITVYQAVYFNPKTKEVRPL